jgi:hypothetical protein
MGLLDSLKSYTASDKGVSLRSKDAVGALPPSIPPHFTSFVSPASLRKELLRKLSGPPIY